MWVTIRLFASHREAAGRESLIVELADGATAADALARACSEAPSLANAVTSVAYALNREQVSADAPLHDGDELALLPPVAGG